MKKNIRYYVFVCVFMFVGIPFAGAAPDPVFWGGIEAAELLNDVPENVITRLENEGVAEYFIVLKEQADVSGAKRFFSKEDRGQYVFDQLVAVADRTQPQLIEDLELHFSDIQRYHIQNMIFVRDGTPEILLSAVNHKMVATIRENRPYEHKNEQPMAYESPESRGIEWNISHVRIPEVWAEGFTGEGIVVGILDTGVHWTHPALQPKYRGWDGSSADHDYNWHDIRVANPVPKDYSNHGTHCLGTIVGDDGAGNQIGGAPGAKWMACAPLDDDAGFHECFEWFLAPYRFGENPSQGVPAMAPHVVNNSWGWPIGGGDYQYAPDLDALYSAGVFMEFSAGNEGDSCQSLRSPGDYPQVFTTGASDVQNRIVSTSWSGWWGSSRGPAHPSIPGAPNFIKPEIAAPGYDIRSSVPGTGYDGGWGGTSMSGPLTCAVVALLWSAAPGLIGDIDATRQILIDSAYTEPGGAGYWNQTCQGINANTTIPNHVWGWGLLDAYTAFQALAGVYLDKPMYQPDDTMIITVRDGDASGSVTVQVQSDIEPQWEYVTLSQTASGQFEGIFQTTSGLPVHGDGAISVEHGSTITVYYSDLDMNTSAVVDGEPPVISNVTVSQVDSRSFTVTWTTDEPARSILHYGETGPVNEVRNEALRTSHSVKLTSLTPCTWYYFTVSGEDQAGNIALDDNNGQYYGAQTYELIVFMEENMNTDPGWEKQNLWQWGAASGVSGNPSSGHTGTHVTGYNLGGNYTNNMPETFLTTGSIDCSAATEVVLSYYHWLGIESSTWDNASVRVSANGGSTWTTVWQHSGGSVQPSSWSYSEFNISDIAAGSSNVKIRWVMGTTDSSVVYCGWNIDDVMVSFENPCMQPTPTPLPTSTPIPDPCLHHGDVNFDGTISAGDAQLAFQIAIGSVIPTYEQECAADCNGDGIVSAGDAQLIFLTALGSESCVDPL